MDRRMTVWDGVILALIVIWIVGGRLYMLWWAK